MPEPDAAAEAAIRSKYAKVGFVGRGAMGAVWRYRDTELGRDVALKFIDDADKEGAIKHAQVLAAIKHQNVVVVHDVLLHVHPESGAVEPTIVMEFLEGYSFADLAGRDISLEDAKVFSRQILAGVGAFWKKEIAHGDLNPGNVMVTESGIKILDPWYSFVEFERFHSTMSREDLIKKDLVACRERIYELLSQVRVPHEGRSEQLTAIHTADSPATLLEAIDCFGESTSTADGSIVAVSGAAEDNAFSHTLPDVGPHIPRKDLESAVLEKLRSDRSVILAGISGVGKSDLAIRVASQLLAEVPIWLDAYDLRPEDLRSITVFRPGLRNNIEFLLKNKDCVLILDNARSAWPEGRLRGLVGAKSHIITTTQIAGARSDTLVVDNADREMAKAILHVDVTSMCPPDIFEEIWAATSGHPLLLRLLGRLTESKQGDWTFAKACCGFVVSDGEDEQNEKVCSRVLKQHLPTIQRELALFVWCNSSSVDIALLRECVSPLAMTNLEKRHLLAASTDRTVRLHDIVFQSAKAEVGLDVETVDAYRERLDNFIQEESKQNSLVLERVARRHNDLLMRELNRRRGSSVLYALARARVNAEVIQSFGDIVAESTLLGGKMVSELDVRSLVEAIEATFSLTSESRSRKEAQEILRQLMPAFDSMLGLSLPSKLLRDIRHHRAKMLTRLEEWSEAEAEFRQILSEVPEQHETALQLVRVVARDRKEEALELAMALVVPELEVAPTVRIAAWAELARLKPEMVGDRIEEILATLKSASGGDVAASYGLVAKVGSSLAYARPEATLALSKAIKESEPTFSSDRERLDWARAQVAAAKALNDAADSEERKVLLESGRAAYESVRAERMSEFSKIQYAENLMLLGDYPAAKDVLSQVTGDDQSEFWWYRLAQVELHLGNVKEAEQAIEKALLELRDAKYRPAFLETRADIRMAGGDRSGLDDLREAVHLAGETKYGRQLAQKLTVLDDAANIGHGGRTS